MAAGRNRQRQAQREAERHKQLVDALTAMNDNFGDLNKANEALVESLKDRDEIAKKEKDANDRLTKGMYRLTDQIPIFGKVFRKITSEIKQTFTTTFKLQERALARGLNLDALRKEIGPLTDQLGTFTGGLTDSLTALEIGTAAWESGLRTNSKSVGMLALQAKLTGGNHKQLLKQMSQNTAGMGMNDAQLGHLAKTTLGLSQNFNITGGQLVDAIHGLGEDLHVFAALDIGADMQEATGTLAAALTPAMSHFAPDLIKSITAGENMVRNAMLGGAEAVGAVLQKGSGPADMLKAILLLGENAQRISDQYVGGDAATRTFALQQFTKVFGKDALLMMRAAQNLKEAGIRQHGSVQAYVAALTAEQKIKDDFTDTWENFKNKIFNPIRDVFMKVSTWFMKILMAWKPLAGILAVLVGTIGVIGGIMVAITALAGIPLIMKGIGTSIALALKGVGMGFSVMGTQAAVGAPGIVAFAAGFVPIALSIAAVAASIGVAGAGLAALFHGWEPEGGSSTAAQTSVTRTVALDRTRNDYGSVMAEDNRKSNARLEDLLRQSVALQEQTVGTGIATVKGVQGMKGDKQTPSPVPVGGV